MDPTEKYKMVKIYGIIHESKDHYSDDDITGYNLNLKQYGLQIIPIKRTKIDELINIIQKDKEDGFTTIVLIICDVFNNVCDDDINGHKIMINKMVQLYSLCTVVPDIDFIFSVGSKKYVADPEFRNLMLPNTYVYPMPIGYDFNYDEQIKGLPEGYYIMKQGYSGSGEDLSYWSTLELGTKKGQEMFLTTHGERIPANKMVLTNGQKIFNYIEKVHKKRERESKERP